MCMVQLLATTCFAFDATWELGGITTCACDLGAVVDRSQPTISHHMKILFDAGLITREKRGLWVWYRIVAERLDVLRAILA